MQIDGIEDLRLIGEGGFARVYHGRQAAFRRDVAVKVLNATAITDLARARFERECLAAGSVAAHPNIVSILHAGTTADGSPYLVMDLVAGGSLAEQVRRRGPLEQSAAIRHGVALAGALESAHRAGVVHRDVKPENILIDDFGAPLLADFGISLVDEAFQTQSGVISATLAHAAPEVVAGQRATASSDVYSLGSTLHAALTGRSPFERTGDEHLAAIIARIMTEPPPDLTSAGLDAEFARVLSRALAKDPSDRWPTALAFGDALVDVGTRLGIHGLRVPVLDRGGDDTEPDAVDPRPLADVPATRRTDITPPAPPPVVPVPPIAEHRRRRSLLAIGLAAIVVAGAAIAWRTLDDGPDPQDRSAAAAGTDGDSATPASGDATASDTRSDDDTVADDDTASGGDASPGGDTATADDTEASIELGSTTTAWGATVDRRVRLVGDTVEASMTVSNPTDEVISGPLAELIPEAGGDIGAITFEEPPRASLRSGYRVAWYPVVLGPRQTIVIRYSIPSVLGDEVLATWQRELEAAQAGFDEDEPLLRITRETSADGDVRVIGTTDGANHVAVDGTAVAVDRRGRFEVSVASDDFPVRVTVTDPLGRQRTRDIAAPRPDGPTSTPAADPNPRPTVNGGGGQTDRPPTPTPTPEPTSTPVGVGG